MTHLTTRQWVRICLIGKLDYDVYVPKLGRWGATICCSSKFGLLADIEELLKPDSLPDCSKCSMYYESALLIYEKS